MWLTTLQPALQELGDDEWAWRNRGEIADVVAEAAAATVRLA